MAAFGATGEFALTEYPDNGAVALKTGTETIAITITETPRVFPLPGVAERTIVVAAEDRTIIVPAEPRTIVVARDDRSMKPPPDKRDIE